MTDDRPRERYIRSEIDGKEYCKVNGQFTQHLRANNITYQQYYERYISGVEQKCPHCDAPKTFYQSDYSYAATCGSSVCIGKEIRLTKAQWTNQQKISDSANKKAAHAMKTPDQIQQTQLKRRKTSLEKYGVEFSTQSENNRQKSRKTKLERYGNEFYAGWEISAEKNRNKSEIEQTKINDKRRQTNINRFGVGCIFLLPDNKAKSMTANSLGKECMLPSGKNIGLRGYEHMALDKLFKEGYNETDLVIHDKTAEYALPVFDYVSVERQHLKYYPDIYIPGENLIIEVKSQWWWDGCGNQKYANRLINNLRKAESVITAGYDYEVWIYDEDTSKFKVTKYEKRIL